MQFRPTKNLPLWGRWPSEGSDKRGRMRLLRYTLGNPSSGTSCHRCCCGARCSPWRERLRCSPTAATRSAPSIRHRRRSHRSLPGEGYTSSTASGLLLRYPAPSLARTPSSFADRCYSLRSLYPPQAALPSLPLPQRGRFGGRLRTAPMRGI